MQFSTPDLFHLMIALSVLITFSYFFSLLFQKFRQPSVIGEILAGLVLGPTLLKCFLPAVYDFIFGQSEATKTVLGMFYQVGLLHLMFCAGMEIQTKIKNSKHEGWVVTLISILGTVVPFGASLLLLPFVNINKFIGTAGNEPAFMLVFSIGIAITSIPVISRIMHDLKILNSSFARVVLSSAVFEDIVLYVLLAIALGLVGTSFGGQYGVPALLGFESQHYLKLIYHILATFIFLLGGIFGGRRFFEWLSSLGFFKKINLLAFMIVFMFIMSGIAILLDIAPMFGAFVGGIVAQKIGGELEKTQKAFHDYSFAYFIPIYFAIVGIKLDLVRAFDPLFFLLFLGFACAVKFISVYVGSRFAGEKPAASVNFGVAMNARGGPGIVLASLAYDAQIINESFYAILVMLALVTSFFAGSWLSHVLGKGHQIK